MQRYFRLSAVPRYLRIPLFVITIYFTFLGGNFITDHSLGPRVFHHTLMLILMGGWCIYLLVRRKGWPATAIDLPIAAFLVVNVLATIFAVDPRISLEELWRLICHIFLFYIIVDLMRSMRPRAVIEPLFFASSVVILVGLMEFTSWYAGLPRLPLFSISWLEVGGWQNPIPPVIYRLAFTLLISTHLSAYMAVLIPVGLAWAISTKSRDTRRALSFWLVGAFIVEILSFSRGGLLSLAVSLPILGALSLLSTSSFKERASSLLRDRRFLASAAVAVILVAGFALIWSRQTNLGGHRAGDVLRFDLWNSAWQIGLHEPVLGVGPYGFGRAMREYRDPEITPDHFVTPHNVPLLYWAETGILGVIALFVMTASLFIAGFNRWRNAGRVEKIRVGGALAALMGFSVQCLFDTFTSSTPIILPPIILAAYLLYRLEPVQRAIPVRRWLPAVALIVLVVAGAAWRLSDDAQRQFQTAIALRDGGNYEPALEAIDDARRRDPALGLYAAQRAQILAEYALSDPSRLPAALEAYEQALQLEDSYDLMQANYGFLLARSGDLDAAIEHLNRASQIRPTESRYHLWIAELASQIGDGRLMQAEYALALEFAPEWAPSAYWDQTPERASARDAFLSELGLSDISPIVLDSTPSTCWPMLVSPDEFSSSHERLEVLHCKAWIDFYVNNDPELALTTLNELLILQPTYGPYALRGEVNAVLGNREAAEEDARLASFYGDGKAHHVLGILAEQAGNIELAAVEYAGAGPVTIQLQGWDVAVYDRRGSLSLLSLPEFDVPGRSRYDLASWLALYELYETTGQTDKTLEVYNAILSVSPYFPFDEP